MEVEQAEGYLETSNFCRVDPIECGMGSKIAAVGVLMVVVGAESMMIGGAASTMVGEVVSTMVGEGSGKSVDPDPVVPTVGTN
jgi:hypothetical protein